MRQLQDFYISPTIVHTLILLHINDFEVYQCINVSKDSINLFRITKVLFKFYLMKLMSKKVYKCQNIQNSCHNTNYTYICQVLHTNYNYQVLLFRIILDI